MKKLFLSARFSACFIFLLFMSVAATAQILDGAWQQVNDGSTVETTCIIEDNYFIQAVYDKANKKFIGTLGGICEVTPDGKMNVTIEFNTMDNTLISNSYTIDYRLDNNKLVITINGENTEWRRIDDGKGLLAGNWRITEREQDGKMNPMQPGPRKTLKILSGTRFQWAAINTDTKEFFGTGGGTYTFKDGRYTETIEFFSRDSSRVGASLDFDGKVEGKRWAHSGKSSKGDKIAEIWTRQSTAP